MQAIKEASIECEELREHRWETAVTAHVLEGLLRWHLWRDVTSQLGSEGVSILDSRSLYKGIGF